MWIDIYQCNPNYYSKHQWKIQVLCFCLYQVLYLLYAFNHLRKELTYQLQKRVLAREYGKKKDEVKGVNGRILYQLRWKLRLLEAKLGRDLFHTPVVLDNERGMSLWPSDKDYRLGGAQDWCLHVLVRISDRSRQAEYWLSGDRGEETREV